MFNCFFIIIYNFYIIYNFTLKAGRATLHTILIDQQAFYLTRASGL